MKPERNRRLSEESSLYGLAISDPNSLVELVSDKLQLFHSNSCYPEAMEGELAFHAEQIIKAVLAHIRTEPYE